LALIASVTAFVILLAAEFTARSRAGLGITMLSLLGLAAVSYFSRQAGFGAPLNRLIFGAVALVVIFSLQFALYRALERIPDTLQDDRPIVAQTTIEAAKAYTPFGSGVGTFVPVYAMFEKPENVSDTYVNHAHNDLLELWLEAGAFGLALLGAFVIWLARRSIQIWRTPPPGASYLDWSMARGATLIPTLLLIHSVFDYPLRTGALMGVMAFACALLLPPPIATASEVSPPLAPEPKSDDLQLLRQQLQGRQARALVPTSSTPNTPAPAPASPEVKDKPPEPGRGIERWGKDLEWPKEWSQHKSTTLASQPNNKPPSGPNNKG
jgi:O-antigen ligase